MDRRERARRREIIRTVLAVPLALVAHAILVALFLGYQTLTKTERPPRPRVQPVTFRTVSSRQWATNEGRALPPTERPVPLHPRGQVVDAAPGNDRVSDESKYLAETNNRVTKETRAREQTNVWSVAAPKNAAHPELTPARKGVASAERAVEAASPFSLQALTLGYRPRYSDVFREAVRAHEAQAAAEEQAQGLPDGANASRSGDAAETGGGAPNDDLHDVTAGDGTALNTREWKYAGFFNRVKQAISAKWDPNGVLRAKGGMIGLEGRHTLLHLTLRPDGSLLDAYVAQGCGLEALDLEAVRAVERAAPFVNPPAGLVENGRIQFGFGFTVTNEGLSPGQMFRVRR